MRLKWIVYDLVSNPLTKTAKDAILLHSMRQIIYFSDDIHKKLKTYIKVKYGKHRAMSFVVQQAVVEFLKREEDRDKGTKKG